jgi:hypothetical protein
MLQATRFRRPAVPRVRLAGVSRPGAALCALYPAASRPEGPNGADHAFGLNASAPAVLEALPRGEPLRAHQIAGCLYEILALRELPFRHCWCGRSVALVASKPWRPNSDRTLDSRTITSQLADLIERLKRKNPYRTGTTRLQRTGSVIGSKRISHIRLPLCRFLDSPDSRKSKYSSGDDVGACWIAVFHRTNVGSRDPKIEFGGPSLLLLFVHMILLFVNEEKHFEKLFRSPAPPATRRPISNAKNWLER